MKDKKKDGEGGGRPRGSRKNIVGSESQVLLQAAAGSGFIGFSAFQTPAAPSFAGAAGAARGGASPAGVGVKASAGTDSGGGQRRVPTARADGGRSSGSTGQVLPPHYCGGNSHLAVVSKRLSKRDVTTKLKALAELRAMCKLATGDTNAAAASPEPSAAGRNRAGASVGAAGPVSASAAAPPTSAPATSAEDLGGLVPHWVFLYQRLSSEGDRRTREAANTTLLWMLRASRRAFQPLMRSLMGAWWCSQADPASEVSSSAREAFEAVFPEAKRASVLRRCAGGVLSQINTVAQQTAEMVQESSGCTAEEAVKRAERLIVSALTALSNFLEAVGDEANSELCAPSSAATASGSGEDAAQGLRATYPSVVNETLWARLDDPRPAVRRATYALVSACCRHAPDLLRPPSPLSSSPPPDALVDGLEGGGEVTSSSGAEGTVAGAVRRRRSRVATPPLLVRLLSEKEESNHREAWQAALLLLRKFRQTWAAEKGAAAVLPTLLTRLRKGDFLATSGTSYPCLLPLVASLPFQTLLAPTAAGGRAGAPPFCAALLETLWTTISKPGCGVDAVGGDRGGSPGWLADVVSAHVECATFLLLKLPPQATPSPGGGTGDAVSPVLGAERGRGEAGTSASGDVAEDGVAAAASPASAGGGGGDGRDAGLPESGAGAVSSAIENVIRAVGSLSVDEEEDDAVAASANAGEGPGGRIQRAGRRSPVIREAFGRALGQLHLGTEKGAGVMGSGSGAAAVWRALVRELRGALDRRSPDGARWMGDMLVRALATVSERQSGDGSGGQSLQSTPPGPQPSPRRAQDGGGLQGVCRALFHHCVVEIGHVGPTGGADGGGRAAISARDAPLVAFMSSVAGVLGMDGIFHMRGSKSVPAGNSGVAAGGGGEAMEGVLSRGAATEFYERFLVPRFVASAASAVAGVGALKTIAERFLLAEDASRQSDDFRLLLGEALAEPVRAWPRTASMVLRLAPPEMARDFPEMDAAVLRACAISSPGGEPAQPGRAAAQELPALLQASLGVRDGGRVTGPPFIKASTVSEVVKVATAAPPADAAQTVAARSARSAALEGLLGVLAGRASKAATGRGDVGANDGALAPGDDPALAAVRTEGISLLLAAFAGFGGGGGRGRVADRLWRDCGAPVLEALVGGGGKASTSASSQTTGDTPSCRVGLGVWRDFLDGAVERTRQVMEDDDGGGTAAAERATAPPRPPRDGAERAATLAWELVELQRTLVRRGAAAPALSEEDAPVLWRLGLTRPSIWRERRLEALAPPTGAEEATAAADLAAACAGSRWARRWKCVSLVLARLPDARARLSLLKEGVVSADDDANGVGVAGQALHEILAAGVVTSRAERLVRGKGYGGMATGDGSSVDLPPGLLSRPRRAMVPKGFDPVEEYGVGLPTFRGLLPLSAVGAAMEHPEAVATAASAGVLDAAAVHLGEKPGMLGMMIPVAKTDDEAESSEVADSGGRQHHSQQQHHPFSLLLPQGLSEVAFESPAGQRSAPAAEDARLHGVLVSALISGVTGVAEDAAAPGVEEGEAGAWRVSCAAEVSTGLLVAVVGETFVRGLGLGDDANRLMASRCGVFKAPAPCAADLVPGARTLYTSDGQAVTIVAAHVDPGGGEGYYTVRPVPEPGTAVDPGRERQTVLERLSVLPPAEDAAAGAPSACPWLVRPSVARELGALLAGPLLAVEQGLWEKLGRSSAGSGPQGPALASATAAALRGLASTCVRAALLCGGGEDEDQAGGAVVGDRVWEGEGPRVLALRNRWASAAVKSGSAVLAARGEGGSSPLEATAIVALSTAVLSAFLAGTPLLPSDQEGMRLMPGRVRGALLAGAAGAGGSSPPSAAAAALGWARAQRAASLAWLRDCAEASIRVHVSPSAGSLDTQIFLDTQAETEAAVVALVSSTSAGRAVGGSSADLALARACGGLFAGESYRLSRGHAPSLSHESKAAVVSWAVSKFLLSGGRMASSSARGRRAGGGGGGGEIDDDTALCLETARLLTAIAWDGRKGWGGVRAAGAGTGGGASSAAAAAAAAAASPYHMLIDARADRAMVWEAARAPAVWRGLHAAVVGAVGSPVLQLCAFEVLEAAAADWRCAVAPPSPEGGGDGDDGGSGGAEGEGGGGHPGKGGEAENIADGVIGGDAEAAPEAGGQSIVSRLARALGGWGLASAQGGGAASGGARGGRGGGAADADREGLEGSGGDGADLSSSEAVQEEAREQQDDLELIARCFPDHLLLAVEALPSTIDALSEVPESLSRDSDRDSYEIDEGDDEQEDEDEDEEEEEEGDSLVGDIPAEEDESGVDDADPAAPYRDGASFSSNGSSQATPTSTDNPDAEEGIDLPHPDNDGDAAPPLPPHGSGSSSSGSKSRRKRLRRRRSGGGTGSSSGLHARGWGRGRRSPAAGPSLTAPFLTWLLWLEHCRRASEMEAKAKSAARAFVVRAGALAPVLEACFRVLRASQVGGGRNTSAAARLGPAQAVRVSRLDPRDPHDLARLALAVYFRTVHVFPALSRSWWADDCVRGHRVWVADFTQRHVSPALIQIEAQVIADATDKGLWGEDGGEMSVRASSNSRQVVASYLKEECTLEAVIQLPPEYPLRNVEVTCSKRMGVSESRWRQWVLQIITLLSLQDGSVLDAVMMWKKNVDKEFEGVEPCVICYSVLHPKTMDLPQMTCKTCSNRFHSSCLYKWFHTSHKNKCPICQQTWA